MREQTCLYMCPWPRIQAALTDEYALNVTYRYDRGEPRELLKHATLLRAQGKPAGDCVDCGQCVAVCPTGVDIRHGASLGCIQCGLCIDACDGVMEKIGRPTRLIAYDTEMNIERRQRGQPSIYKPIRARTIIYAALIVLIGGFMLFTLAMRADMRLNVLHDRNPLTVTLKDGSVRNAYTIRISNMKAATRRFTLEIAGAAGAQIDLVGETADTQGHLIVEVGVDQTLRGARAGDNARRACGGYAASADIHRARSRRRRQHIREGHIPLALAPSRIDAFRAGELRCRLTISFPPRLEPTREGRSRAGWCWPCCWRFSAWSAPSTP